MLKTLLGSKMGMSQTFVGDTRVPVTCIKAGPCVVTQVKRVNSDGYWAVQLGFGTKSIKNITKPLQGHLKGALSSTENKEPKTMNKAPRFLRPVKAGLARSTRREVRFLPRYLREVKFKKKPDLKVGDRITVSKIFKKGDVVSVTGTSKGKGFTGVIKRWGFSKGPRTHGQSDRLRSPGSIGATGPGRVWKGKKMAGRSGTRKRTINGLVVVEVDEEKDELLVSGPVPGNRNGLLIITKLAEGKLSELEQEGPQVAIVEGSDSDKTDDSKSTGETEAE